MSNVILRASESENIHCKLWQTATTANGAEQSAPTESSIILIYVIHNHHPRCHAFHPQSTSNPRSSSCSAASGAEQCMRLVRSREWGSLLLLPTFYKLLHSPVANTTRWKYGEIETQCMSSWVLGILAIDAADQVIVNHFRLEYIEGVQKKVTKKCSSAILGTWV